MIRALALLFSLASLVRAQTIVGPTGPVGPYEFAAVKVEGYTAKPGWLVVAADGRVGAPYVRTEGGGIAFTSTPGKCVVLAVVNVDGAPTFLQTDVIFSGKAPGPGPTPVDPDPVDPPPPDPGPLTPLQQAARNYAFGPIRSIEEAAYGLERGTITTNDQVLNTVYAARLINVKAFSQALDEARAPFLDASGNIKDPKGYAAVLKLAVAGVPK